MTKIEIESLLGQAQIFEAITKQLHTGSFLVLGDIGQGKKYLLNKIEQYCQITNEMSVSFQAFGLQYDYAPFLKAISKKENIFVNQGIELVKNLSEFIPNIGNVIKTVATQKELFSAEFTETECEIINRLKRMCPKGRIIFICYEVSKWDNPSRILLTKILQNPNALKRDFSAICSDYNETCLNNDLFNQIFHLGAISINNAFNVIKTLFSNTRILPETAECLCKICNGNIGILKNVVSHLPSDEDIHLYNKNSLHDLLASQIIGNNNCLLLLDKASIVGCESSKKVLEAYTNFNEFDFCEIVEYAESKNFLLNRHTSVSFTNDSIWEIFYSYSKKIKKYHYDYVNCLKAIMPSQYLFISNEYLLSGMEEQSVIYYILSCLHDVISYHIKPIINERMQHLLSLYNLTEYFTSMIKLYQKYFDYSIEEDCCFPQVNERLLEFEADYLEAIYLYNYKISKSYYYKAYHKMKKWFEDKDFADKSSEQWLRAAFFTLNCGIELGEHAENLHFEIIEKTVSKYMNTDNRIIDMHYDFLAKSNGCFSIEIASKNVIEALSYFEQHEEMMPSSSKYIATLNNALANSIVMGEFTKSAEMICKLSSYVNTDSLATNNFGGAISNNVFLLTLLKSFDTFSQMFTVIENTMKSNISYHKDEISNVLYKNNLAVFYIYLNFVDKADAIFNELFYWIEDNCDIDHYYIYFIKNNYYLLKYLKSGEIDNGFFFHELNSLTPSNTDINYFSARNIYIQTKLKTEFKFTPHESNWNDFKENRVGKAWSFWGKWFLLSDIQFWSD